MKPFETKLPPEFVGRWQTKEEMWSDVEFADVEHHAQLAHALQKELGLPIDPTKLTYQDLIDLAAKYSN